MKSKLICWTTSMAVCLFTAQARCHADGNVQAFLGPDDFGENTVLTVVGDNASNEIRITQDAADHVLIEGLGGTTVNGKAADDLYAAAQTGIFLLATIDVGNGDDYVEVIFTGDERSPLTWINTGKGNDEVRVSFRGSGPGFRIDTGSGNDIVSVHFPADPGDTFLTGVLDHYAIYTGSGDDAVFVESENADRDRDFRVLLNGALIETAEGNDLVSFIGERWRGVTPFVLLGGGDDVLIGDPESRGDVDALGGAGSDTILNAAYFSQFGQFETIVE